MILETRMRSNPAPPVRRSRGMEQNLGYRPLSAKTGETPCGLGLYCCHLRIGTAGFAIADPTAPVLPLSLQLGTISYRICGHARSLSRKADGRRGNPYGKDARRSSPILTSGIGNREPHILFGNILAELLRFSESIGLRLQTMVGWRMLVSAFFTHFLLYTHFMGKAQA